MQDFKRCDEMIMKKDMNMANGCNVAIPILKERLNIISKHQVSPIRYDHP